MLEEFVNNINSNYMPHGHCYFWEPFILWSHALSDSIIALAYITIPISLVKIVRSRKDNDFSYMWILVLFAVFILGCGATHIMDVINIWEPWYYTDSFIRIITAMASIGTALMLVRITPQLILFPSTKRWQEMNEELKSLNESLERKVQERTHELETLAERYRFLTDAIPQIVWSAGPDGKADHINATWYTYTGQTPEEAKEEGLLSQLHPDDLEKANSLFGEALRKGETFEAKLRIRNKEGSYCWHLTRSVPMKSKEGTVLRWFGTSTNIHDQIVKTEELQRTNEELDNFVYTASHDLKTPVLNIEGLIQLIKAKVPAAERTDIQNIYTRMDKSVQQLKQTITDLADITRIQREDAEENQLVNLEELVAEFKLNHEVLYENTGAVLELALEEKEIRCISKKHMRSLLDNLLSNALKYRHPSRQPHVLLSCKLEEDDYLISVSDNGVGIPLEYQHKVFDMFKRFHTHTPGTGVGLYIVKKIIEKYDGSIDVSSMPEEGTTFTVRLHRTTDQT